LIIIGGAAIGALIISAGPSMIGKIVQSLLGLLKPDRTKKDYVELLMLLNVLFTKIRVDGAISIEADIEKPGQSPIFSQFPSVLKDHHAVDFICDNLRVFITIGMEAHEFDNLMEIDMEAMHSEELKPASFLNTTADSLPGMGIVAAVLGVVITMGKISEPPEVLGHSIGAALVGTFLGILLCYGFFGPMAKAMETKVHSNGTYLTVIRTTLVTFIANSVPQIAIEAGRRAVPGKMRPKFAELEEELKKSRKK
jgi:chemotaxis protein MotA